MNKNSTIAAGLNEHHQRHVRSTFQYIDKLLSEAEHAMADASSPSPFQQYSDDTTPVQRKVTHDYIVRLREAMARIMNELSIEPAEPRCGAVWAAGISMMFSSISLGELSPEKMRSYGELSEEAARLIDGIRVELSGLVAKLSNYLGQAAGGDLQARLERLAKTGNEIELLRELERIVTAHGLVEFRAALTTLIDRFETAAFEAGVFGRVSSGKSSLLNYILQTDILPVGVTPVTAIPTRISHGPIAEAGIEFAEAQARIIDLSELAEYATEEKNPGNAKHVTRIVVKLPSPRLSEGVTFVDTPGLGSLAVAGAEETVAYLPRCDLGIVLVDASSGLTQDDLVVVQALYQAGATASVLISKADLFSAADRERMVDYVKKHLRTELNVEPPVDAISIMGDDAALCDRWFEEELQPMLARHRELTAVSHKRKAGALREAVMAVLQRRLQVASEMGGAPDQGAGAPSEAVEAIRTGERALERAQGAAFHLARKISNIESEIIDSAAKQMAHDWAQSDSADPAKIFSDTVTRMLTDPVSAILRAVEETRGELGRAMQLAATVSNQPPPDELPKPAGLPALDANKIAEKIDIIKPSVLSLFGVSALAPNARRQLEKQINRDLFEFLSLYSNRLRRLMEQTLGAMRKAFIAATDIHRAQFEAVQFQGSPDASTIEADLRILQTWQSG
jgi:GTP-binding protein EngB required for normal cell division